MHLQLTTCDMKVQIRQSDQRRQIIRNERKPYYMPINNRAIPPERISRQNRESGRCKMPARLQIRREKLPHKLPLVHPQKVQAPQARIKAVQIANYSQVTGRFVQRWEDLSDR